MDINAMLLSEIWQEIEKKANEKPELIKDMNASYLFDISGPDSGTYGLIFKDGKATVDVHLTEADCTFHMNVDNFKKLLQGNLNAMTAVMSGRVKVKGNMKLALPLESLLHKYDL